MRLLNLFDGIGGFGLAAKWMGWENVASCEIDPYCRRVLDYWFDYKYIYDDIKTTDFAPLRGHIDLVTGGFPCQPFSLAGKQLGEKDDRYLWPHMLRAIREVRPRWVVAENVRGLLTQSDGMVFEQVCADMEAEGYEVQPFVLPAAGVGAPHRRDRLWIVAHRADAGAESERERQDGIHQALNVTDAESERDSGRSEEIRSEKRRPDAEINAEPFEHGRIQTGIASDAVRLRGDEIQQQIQSEESNGFQSYCVGEERSSDNACSSRRNENHVLCGSVEEVQGTRKSVAADSARDAWRDFPTQSPVCRGDDGLSGRLVGITFPKWCEQSVKGFGNSIVPHVAYQTFRAIDYYENRPH